LKLRICAKSGDWPQMNMDFHRWGKVILIRAIVR